MKRTERKPVLTLERLQELLDYSPETGVFKWRSSGKGRAADLAAGAFCNGYVSITLDYERHYAHRLAWLYVTGRWPVDQVDHINGDKADNRFPNLRLATPAQNSRNQKRRVNNKSGLKGVSPTRWGYQAQITTGTGPKHLGYFGTAQEAHAVYCEAAREHFGEFARAG